MQEHCDAASELTPLQKGICEYVTDYIQKYRSAPSYEQIGDRFDLARQTVHKKLFALRARGLLPYYNQLNIGTAVPDIEPVTIEFDPQPEPEPRKVKSMLIQESELTAVGQLEPGQPFVIPNDTVVKVLCKVVGDCGCRGAANAACVVLATEYEGADGIKIGAALSIPKHIQVQKLELVQSPVYRKV